MQSLVLVEIQARRRRQAAVDNAKDFKVSTLQHGAVIPLAEQLNLATRLYRAAVLAFRCQPEAHRLVSSPSFIKVANHRACVVQINRHDVHRLLL
jgi:hypothetical protein